MRSTRTLPANSRFFEYLGVKFQDVVAAAKANPGKVRYASAGFGAARSAIVSDLSNGTPVIFANQVACELCEDFPCIAACATDALLPVSDSLDVRMGMAPVSHRVCTAGQGCHACVSKCPVDALSMDFHALRLVVEQERCVGCGMCEQICKTVNDRIAVKVVPARNLSAGSLNY